MFDNAELKPSEIAEAIERTWKAKRMPFIHSGPGCSKSSLVAQLAEMMNLPLYDVRAAQLDPVDLRGLPMVIDGVTHWARASFIPDKPAILFFDEVNRAPTLVQNACFQLFLDRRLGEIEIGDGVLMVAAGNRESDGGGVMRMPSALGNRLVHLYLRPDIEDWATWAHKNNIDQSVIAYLKQHSQNLYKFDRDTDAWPSPRSWHFVSDILQSEPSQAVEQALIAGSVGQGAMLEFVGYLNHWRELPDINKILNDPDNAPLPKEGSPMYATAYAVSFKATVDNFDRVIRYVSRLPEEFNTFAISDALKRDPALDKTAAFTSWAKNHVDFLTKI